MINLSLLFQRALNYTKAGLYPILIFLVCIAFSCTPSNEEVFDKDNLVAWCVVPFDAENRGPEERAKMLKDLGITMLAYDWRDEHIPTFDEEYQALQDNGVHLQSMWLMSGQNPATDIRVQTVFDFLERNDISTEIWLLVEEGEGFGELTQEEKIKAMSGPVAYVAERAAPLGSKVALYNHGNWFGEPENQLAIIDQLDKDNIGMVFNFHHAAPYQDRFAEFFPKIKPHLYAVNLAGLKKGDRENFFEVGKGNAEQEMIRIIKESDYDGPIGIINHDTQRDAKKGLEIQMTGLEQILDNMENN